MELSPRFADALTFAFDLHRMQERKGTGIPYFSHLMSVAALALENGADEETAVAALLHDAVEDQGGREMSEKIRRRFGDRVADIVAGCTDAEVKPKPPWRQRKEAYIAHLAGASADVVLVSACDKLHNARAILADLRAIGDALWERFAGGKEGSLWYYRSLVAAFQTRFAEVCPQRKALVEELDRVVAEIERLAGK
ncbi:MAG: HD domain-containing protein [Candidatus Riflebacteria bacterium]|nr:HD domain-containing protein [Candidatus Riflebacteria bacterium]